MNNSKISVRLEPLGKIIRVSSGTPLKDILFQYGVEFPCGGKGTCGGCKVKVLKGHLPLDEKQSKLLKDGGFGDEYRLACKAVATQDVSLEIGQFDTFVLADNTSFHFTPKKDFGIAIDIGTTTLVAQLLNLETGQVKDAITALNPQSEYGVDIISRIQYAVFEKGHDKLKTLIWQEISKMVNKLIKRNSTKVTDIVLVGNTVMQHLFDGTDLTPLSAFPFETKEKDFSRFTSAELGLKTDPDTRITFIPSIGSFIGSDIMAGILASRMHESDSYIALIDLGTNGEIAVGNKNGIFCASTAAGPAFEGTNISMGMRATNGAISSVSKEGEKLHCHVIGNDSPRGICGSGLIDAVAVFIQEGKIDIGGKIIGNSKKLDLSYPVVLSQKDIREFQLAKGAARWQNLNKQQKALALNRLNKWKELSPAERKKARNRYQCFQKLDPQQRKRLWRLHQRFKKLSPEQKRTLRNQYEQLSPEQKRRLKQRRINRQQNKQKKRNGR